MIVNPKGVLFHTEGIQHAVFNAEGILFIFYFQSGIKYIGNFF
jgi:hypothetical protein